MSGAVRVRRTGSCSRRSSRQAKKRGTGSDADPADVCVDEYTSHGHCGIVKDGKILNDETLDCPAGRRQEHAQAGADMVAPSDMMEWPRGAIRGELDRAGFPELPIMACSAKFASCFYAPFRDAANSSPPRFGDRQSYQMDPTNKREALREIDLDVEEGRTS
ncbi:MAG: hypothetical protein U0361_04230 [Nitrospiraceae bacterium]